MALQTIYPVICLEGAFNGDPTGLCTALSFLGTFNPVAPETPQFAISTAGDAALINEFLACGGVTGCSMGSPPADPIDYASLGAIWTFGFVSVLILWLVAKNAGIIVDAVRRF